MFFKNKQIKQLQESEKELFAEYCELKNRFVKLQIEKANIQILSDEKSKTIRTLKLKLDRMCMKLDVANQKIMEMEAEKEYRRVKHNQANKKYRESKKENN